MAAGANRETIVLEYKIENGELVSGKLKKMTDELTKNERQADSSTRALTQFWSQSGLAAKLSSAAIVAAAGSAVAASIRMGAQFETSMLTVQTVSSSTREEMEMLSREARRLGASTAYTATQVGEGMIGLARAGQKMNQIMQTTEPILKLAGAQVADMGETTKIVTASLAQYNIAAGDTRRVTDSLAYTASNSLTDLTGLGYALTYAGTAAGSMGHSIEDTLTVLAQFHNLGMDGSLAGTALKMGLQSLMAPSNQLWQALEKLNIQYEEINPLQHQSIEIIERLAKSTLEADDAVRIFGARAAPAFYSVVNAVRAGTIDLRAFEAGMKRAQEGAGLAAKQYEDMISGSQGQWDIMWSAIGELGLKTFDRIQPAWNRLLGTVTAVVNKMNELADEAPKHQTGLAGQTWAEYSKMINSPEFKARFTDPTMTPGGKLIGDAVTARLRTQAQLEIEAFNRRYGLRPEDLATPPAPLYQPVQSAPDFVGQDEASMAARRRFLDLYATQRVAGRELRALRPEETPVYGDYAQPSNIPDFDILYDQADSLQERYQVLGAYFEDSLPSSFQRSVERINTLVSGLQTSFDSFYSALYSGSENAAAALLKANAGMIGQMAAQQGQFYLLKGLAALADPLSTINGTGMIVQGLALMNFGAALGAATSNAGRGGYGSSRTSPYNSGRSDTSSSGNTTSGGTKLIVLNVSGSQDIDRSLERAGVDRQVRETIYELRRSGALR